jgi:thioester reductase-like protein
VIVTEFAEPIAIIGMACHYPGRVRSPEGLWELVISGREAVTQFPADRGWDLDGLRDGRPGHVGHSLVDRGGFLDVADFDAGFFGISPREATAMHPEQRILLEVAWEACERAKLDPLSLRGTDVGVFAARLSTDYGPPMHAAPEEYAGLVLTGTTPGAVSGRIAYALGVTGPAITVDAASSGSLVAIHLAVQSLRAGECELALAGGVSVAPAPGFFTEFTRQRGLAPDGRPKPFSDDADGTVWSEGAGIVVLTPLSEARRRGDDVLAVVRGSAVNSDGATESLAVPSASAQERLITRALAQAGLQPADIDAVEAHGSGTRVGDRAEAGALVAVFGGGGRGGRPLWVGSVKSNIGHAQAAAGVAGVIKMVMALRHGVLPPLVHFSGPSREVDWRGVVPLAEGVGWPRSAGRVRRCGVSSFGISGTNAHVIVEEAAEPEEPAADAGVPGGVVPWVVSARSAEALRARAAELAGVAGSERPADVGFSLAVTRSVFECRAVVSGAGREELAGGLAALARGEAAPGVVSETAFDDARPVFVFPGQGWQWPGMAAGLLESSAVFAGRVAECEEALGRHVPWSLTGVLRGEPGAPGMDRVDVGQPVLWAVMVSLAAVWRGYGVEPAAVVGHSQGEIAAACVAGALSLDDAALAVTRRSALIVPLSGSGAMISLGLGAQAARERLARWDADLAVAAVNGPSSVVVSGTPQAVAELQAACDSDGIHARMVKAYFPGHCWLVDPLRGPLGDALGGVRWRAPVVPMVSTVTGEFADGLVLDGGYWWRNLRQTVEFERATRTLLGAGHRLFIEVSGHPVLGAGLQETIDDAGAGAAVIGTLRRDDGGQARLVTSLAQAFTRGAPVSWAAHFTGTPRRVTLPTYPFQRQRYWLSEPEQAPVTSLTAAGLEEAGHPLLGAGVELADAEGYLFTASLTRAAHPWLADHVLGGQSVLPGASLVELALRAGEQVGAEWVDELALEAPLALPEDDALQVQLTVGKADEEGRRTVSVHSRPGGIGTWTRHAAGVISPTAEPPVDDPSEWPPAGAEPMDVDAVYARVARVGMTYGPAFRGLRKLWRLGTQFYAECRIPDHIAPDAQRYGMHPALLDAALHGCLAAAAEAGLLSEQALLPFSFSGVGLYAVGASDLRARITVTSEAEYSVDLADGTGSPAGRISALAFRPAGNLGAQARQALAGRALFGVRWTPPAARAAATSGVSLSVVSWDGSPLSGQLSDAGLSVTTFTDIASAARAGRQVVLDVPPAAAGRVSEAGQGTSGDVGATAGLARAVQDNVLAVLHRARKWLAATEGSSARLAVCTHRGIAAAPEEDVTDLAAAAVWGLIRSAQGEHPGRFVLVDIDAAASSASSFAAALSMEEDQIAIRGGALSVPRIGPLLPDAEPTPLAGPEQTVLITGGAGGLGGRLARHLVSGHGIRHLVLAGRRGPESPGAGLLHAELTGLGAEVRIAACDVADYQAVADLLGSIPPAHPLGAVIHAAGVRDDGTLNTLTDDQVERVLRAKVDGAVNLNALTRNLGLSCFIMFSSVAGVLGTQGQANYAAGNAFLDALAHRRRAAGLSGLSLAWGPWGVETNMSEGLTDADRARLARWGMQPLAPDDGWALFDMARAADTPLAVPCHIELAAAHDVRLLPGMLRDKAGEIPRPRADEDQDISEHERLRISLASMTAAQRQEELVRIIRQHAAEVAHLPSADAVPRDESLLLLGFDSLAALELRTRLVRLLGLTKLLPANAVYQTPVPQALAERIAAALTDTEPAEPAQAAAAAESALESQVKLAADIVPAAERGPLTLEGSRHLFVTGATGFIGAFLLAELLTKTRAVVHCLVRAADADEGARRLRDTLRRYRLIDDRAADRVVPVVGDLSQPRLGLAEGEFDALAATIDGVYHVGATVDVLLRSYEDLRAANVDGTEEVLRLAARHRTVPVHHVSSVAIFGVIPDDPRLPMAEETPTGPPSALTHGYEQTKWVAEGLVRLARERGLPISVYRVSRAFGDRGSGACQTEDMLWRALKGCVQAGAVPTTALNSDIVPVDSIAAAIVGLSWQEQSVGGTFHLSNPQRLPFAAAVAALADYGYPLAEVPPQLWADMVRADPGNAAYPVIEFFSEGFLSSGGWGSVPFSCHATRRALEPLGLVCPPVTPELLTTNIQYFVETGYLPGPGE